MKYDLHCHSHLSDGTLNVEQLLAEAVAAKLSLFAITDHDNIDSWQQVQASDQLKPTYCVPGVELSAQWQKMGVHIVGLDFDPNNQALQQFLARQQQVRLQRAKTISDRLAKKGMAGAFEGAQQYCEDVGQLGRPHIAQFLVAQGYCTSTQQAFKKWLGNGKLGDVKQLWPEMDKAIAVIRQAGGVPVLAHPLKYNLTFSKLKLLLKAFCEAEGVAVEVTGQGKDNQKTALQKVVAELGLLASGGSDFHNPEWLWAQLGCAEAIPQTLKPVWQAFQHTHIQ